jgi:hypothetical protein
MIRRTALASGAAVAVGFLAACSDSPTQPSAMVRNVAPPSFALLQQPTNNPDGPNTITVCSAVASATFNVTFDNGLGTKQIPPLAGAGPTYTLNVAANSCETIWSKPGVAPGTDPTTTATVVQTGQAAGYQFLMVEAAGVQNINPGAADNLTKTAQLTANAFHGSTATFTQQLIPVEPQVCDFSTFGGFTLENNYNISYGGNAGKVEEGFAYGDLNFVNHTTGDQIHVWNVTGYGHPATGPLSSYPDSRFASGKGEINGSGSFDVEFRFVDLGEPGTSDRVWLKVNGNVLIQEQVVQGGNIQLHSVCKKAPKAEKH